MTRVVTTTNRVQGTPEPAGEVSDLERRYEALRARVLSGGAALLSDEAAAVGEDWEAVFVRYRSDLRALKALGEERRPSTLRNRQAQLADRELASELAELFAA